MEKRQKSYSYHLLHLSKSGSSWAGDAVAEMVIFLEREREREPLFSSFLTNLTVGILRSKKESRSMWVPVLRSFNKLREVGVLFYLGLLLV